MGTKVINQVSEKQKVLESQMVAMTQSKDREIRALRDRIARMEESQLKIIELLNNPAMVKNIRVNPEHFIAAANAADEDVASYIKQVSRDIRK
jgi:Mg2+ and Co2+ transporter CorA